MSYNIEFKKPVEKDLRKISAKDTTKILEAIENDLAENGNKQPMLHGEFKGLRKYKVGNFRIIYVILDQTILILRIADRKDVYKNPIS